MTTRTVARTLATVGVDIGQLADPTAISVARYRRGEAEVRFLERLPLQTRYPDVARRVANVVHNLKQALYQERSSTIPVDIVVLVDVTGIGRATFDMLKEELPRNLSVLAVTLTAGTAITRKGDEWHVPKQDLVDNLRRYVEEGRLQVAQTSTELRALQSEMRTFSGQKTSPATTTTGARSGAHDDLVIAVGLALLPGARPRRPSGISRARVARDTVDSRLVPPGSLTPEQQQIQSALDAIGATVGEKDYQDRMWRMRGSLARPTTIPPGTVPGPR